MAFLTEAANRGSVSTGYDIPFSCKFEQDNSEAMTRTATQSQAGDSRKTWTWSGWIKRTELGNHMYLFSAGGTGFQILSTDNLRFSLYYNNTSYYLDLNAKLRDTSAWYHIVGQLDTTQSTAQDRVKVWINGERQTSFSNDSAHNIPQNVDVQHLNEATGTSTAWMKICDWYASGRFFRGYAAEWHFTDGVANEPTEFGEYASDSGIWSPKEYTGNYGTNGFYLDFADAADLGDDESGNGNDFTENNISAADQSTDTPTNNFCTLNPLIPYAVQSGAPVINEGSTKHNGSGGWTGMKGTIGVNKGKWYWELRTNSGSGSELIHGVQTVSIQGNSSESTATSAHNLLETAAWYVNGGHWIKDETSGRDDIPAGSITQTYGNSVIHAVALNMDDGEITYYANGSVVSGLNQVDLDGLAGETVAPFASVYNQQVLWNFGGYTTITISSAASDENGYGTFEYAPPSGYYALCTKNLAEFG